MIFHTSDLPLAIFSPWKISYLSTYPHPAGFVWIYGSCVYRYVCWLVSKSKSRDCRPHHYCNPLLPESRTPHIFCLLHCWMLFSLWSLLAILSKVFFKRLTSLCVPFVLISFSAKDATRKCHRRHRSPSQEPTFSIFTWSNIMKYFW